MIQLAAFAGKPAKIRSMISQRIKASAIRAFGLEGLGEKGRTIEIKCKPDTGIGGKPSQLLRCYADQPILLPNSS